MVYLHEKNRFEVWLGGSNRKVQTEHTELFRSKDTGYINFRKCAQVSMQLMPCTRQTP
ncbi:MAG: DUF7000 family protein [Saccharofermentanales bacterium]